MRPDDDGRPVAFLVSTTLHARAIRDRLGSPAYSYAFVLEALKPALERLGTWRLIERPESQVSFAARRAEAEGFRPVHLAIVPPQDAYFAPDVPNVLFPFWEFPRIPDRDFGHDTRQNWARMCRGADLILTACRFTAEAFERAGVDCPVAVVPVPVPASRRDVPDWAPGNCGEWTCRHEIWGGLRASTLSDETTPTPAEWGLSRRLARQIAAKLPPRLVGGLCGLKQAVSGRSSAQITVLAARFAYNRTLRRVLSDRAIRRVTAIKERLLARLGRPISEPLDPILPAKELRLSGLVFTTFANVGDRRKNLGDILSAFLIAFRDREDATLVLKLASSPRSEHQELTILRTLYRSLGIEHDCRVVVLTDFLDEPQLNGLLNATTFYLNASHAEGACLPLQQALAAGRPAIAPDHTAMADYIDDSVALVVGSSPEPTYWPHDPEERIETERQRIHWSDLHAALLQAAEIHDGHPEVYTTLAENARQRIAEQASVEVSAAAIKNAMQCLQTPSRRSAG